jgi:erythromycin esterase-like protein
MGSPVEITKRSPAQEADLPALIRQYAEPLPDLHSSAFAELFDRYGDARVVLIGEASHGTSDFYRTRAAITQRLIERHGFNIVAVEADWPDAAQLDRFARQRNASAWTQSAFTRFPTWMWRNTDVSRFIHWTIWIRSTRSRPSRHASAMAACRPGRTTRRAMACTSNTAKAIPARRPCSLSSTAC